MSAPGTSCTRMRMSKMFFGHTLQARSYSILQNRFEVEFSENFQHIMYVGRSRQTILERSVLPSVGLSACCASHYAVPRRRVFNAVADAPRESRDSHFRSTTLTNRAQRGAPATNYPHPIPQATAIFGEIVLSRHSVLSCSVTQFECLTTLCPRPHARALASITRFPTKVPRARPR